MFIWASSNPVSLCWPSSFFTARALGVSSYCWDVFCTYQNSPMDFFCLFVSSLFLLPVLTFVIAAPTNFLDVLFQRSCQCYFLKYRFHKYLCPKNIIQNNVPLFQPSIFGVEIIILTVIYDKSRKSALTVTKPVCHFKDGLLQWHITHVPPFCPWSVRRIVVICYEPEQETVSFTASITYLRLI